MASDSAHVESMYNLLTAKGLRVWWDKICLQAGKPWEDGFCDGLVSSKSFICLISADAIAHPTNLRQNFSQLSANSACDNVLLEHQLALELHTLGLVEFIFPIFIGSSVPNLPGVQGLTLGSFNFGCLGNMPSLQIPAVVSKVCSHMERQCLGAPLNPDITVKDVVQRITSFQGGFAAGDAVKAFDVIADSIFKMCQQPLLKKVSKLSIAEQIRLTTMQMISQNAPMQDIDNYIVGELSSLGV